MDITVVELPWPDCHSGCTSTERRTVSVPIGTSHDSWTGSTVTPVQRSIVELATSSFAADDLAHGSGGPAEIPWADRSGKAARAVPLPLPPGGFLGSTSDDAVQVDRAEAVARRHVVPGPEPRRRSSSTFFLPSASFFS